MTLGLAQQAAAALMDWLRPRCERLELAGSIRRERPEPADIDLVAIPKIQITRDLLGDEVARENLCAAALRAAAALRPSWRVEKDGPGCMIVHAGGRFGPCQVDLWWATPATFGTLWLCRTGSKEHNILLCQRAERLGGHWNPHRGVVLRQTVYPAVAERDIYAALQLPWIEPRDREHAFVHRLLRSIEQPHPTP